MKDFVEAQLKMREELDTLLTMKDVRVILACSVSVVIRLIKSGDLEAFDITGKAADKIDEHSYGLRITPSSLKHYLERVRVS